MATKSGRTKTSKTAQPSNAPKNAEPKIGKVSKDDKAKPVSPKKAKRIRGTFSIPENDYALIGELKARLKARKLPAKKNQLLRAGLRALAEMTPVELQDAIDSLSATRASVHKKK